MKALMARLWKEEAGQGMTEYALIIGIVAVFLVAALVVFRGKIADLFSQVQFTSP